MKPEAMLAELENAADRRAIKVSYEALQASVGSGGLCRVKGAYRVIIDKRASTGERLSTLAGALAQVGLGELVLSAAVRDLIALHSVDRRPDEAPPRGGVRRAS
jgi:hypothetical protein